MSSAPPVASESLTRRSARPGIRSLQPLALALAAIALWTTVGALINDTPFPDTVEQFVWAHSFENAYWKHPPLTTWLLRGVILTFGYWSGWAYVLAALCFAGTAFFTWRIAGTLLGESAAGLAVLLLGLHFAMSVRAQLYNHNTVLMLFTAMAAWSTLRARASERMRDWCAAGCIAALAILSKYQAVLPLAGIAIALGLEGSLRERSVRRGATLAATICVLLVLPHFAAISAGSKTPVSYAASQFGGADVAATARNVASHFVVQLRFHAVMLLTAALLLARARREAPHRADASPPWSRSARAWMIGLVAWPAAFIALVPLVTGLHLHSQWGFGAFQFTAIWLAGELVRRMPPLAFRQVAAVVIGSHAIWLAGYVASSLAGPAEGALLDRRYPAKRAAAQVLAAWQGATSCPLQWISGPAFEGGAVSMHLPGFPAVLEDDDLAKSPWIDRAAMTRDGYVALAPPAGSLSGAVLLPPRGHGPALQVIVHAPTACRAAAASVPEAFNTGSCCDRTARAR